MPTFKTAEAVGRSTLDLIPKCVGALLWCPHFNPTTEDSFQRVQAKTMFWCTQGPLKVTSGDDVQVDHLEATTKWIADFAAANFLPIGQQFSS